MSGGFVLQAFWPATLLPLFSLFLCPSPSFGFTIKTGIFSRSSLARKLYLSTWTIAELTSMSDIVPRLCALTTVMTNFLRRSSSASRGLPPNSASDNLTPF